MHDNCNKLEYGYSLYVRRSPWKDKQVKALMKIRSCIQEAASLKSDTFLKQILTCKRSIKRSQGKHILLILTDANIFCIAQDF
jgi:hypothetical protein